MMLLKKFHTHTDTKAMNTTILSSIILAFITSSVTLWLLKSLGK